LRKNREGEKKKEAELGEERIELREEVCSFGSRIIL
jgi:hypothetical protein